MIRMEKVLFLTSEVFRTENTLTSSDRPLLYAVKLPYWEVTSHSLKRNPPTRCTLTACILQGVLLSRNRQGGCCVPTDDTAWSKSFILTLKTERSLHQAGPSSSQFSRSCTSCMSSWNVCSETVCAVGFVLQNKLQLSTTHIQLH